MYCEHAQLFTVIVVIETSFYSVTVTDSAVSVLYHNQVVFFYKQTEDITSKVSN